MRVEGLAERTEIAVDAVESQSSTWGFLREGSCESFLGQGMFVASDVGAYGDSVGLEVRLPLSRQRSK